jgi:anti-sigma factor RsiW
MALGATYQLMRGELGGGPGERTAEEAYLDYRRNRAVPTLSSGEVRQVADWLTAELGRPVVLPPVPDGYRLVGATRADLAGAASGALIYTEVADPESAPVMLFVSDAPGAPAEPVELSPPVEDDHGLHQVRWSADRLSYTAVGEVPSDRLLQFHH